MSSSPRIPTPIPIGPKHVARPPMFKRWGMGPGQNQDAERRDYSRRDATCNLWLIDTQSQSVLRCKSDNISDAGLHGSAPIGYGLALGQRYEVRIAAGEPDKAISPHIAKSLGFATVVRSGIEVNDGVPDRVGFAIRFDVPQLIPV